MSVRYIDGMDTCSGVEMRTRYDLVVNFDSSFCTTTTTAGRFAGPSYRLQSIFGVVPVLLGHSAALVSKMIVGCWFAHAANIGLSVAILSLRSSGTEQVGVYFTSQHTLELYTAGVLRGSSVSSVADAGHVLELEAYWHANAGSATLYYSGVAMVSYTGSTTTAGASGFNQALYGAAAAGQHQFDDFYCLDDLGDTNTSRLGPAYRIRTHRVNSAAVSAWTPVGAATNDAAVDETLPDDATTYVHTSAASALDRYEVTAATGVYSASEIPRAVNLVARAIAPSGGSPTLRVLCELSGVSASGPLLAASTAWSHNILFPVSTRPGASTWAVSHIDALTIGIENGIAAPTFCTWLAAEVLTASGASQVLTYALTASLVWTVSGVSGVRNPIMLRSTVASAAWIVSGGVSSYAYNFVFGDVGNQAGFVSVVSGVSLVTRTWTVAGGEQGQRRVSSTVTDASAASITSATTVFIGGVTTPNYYTGTVTLSSQPHTRTFPI